MAKLTRVTGKVFASDATATVGGIGQFGSAKTGTPNPTTDVATIQALQAYLDGWGSAVIAAKNFPPLEEVNGVLKTISYQACYILQEGIPEYDINTNYSNTSIVKSINGDTLSFYISLKSDNLGNALSDSTSWVEANVGANVSLSNVNNAAKILMSNMGMPSDTYTPLTVGANGTTYTATSNGWVGFKGQVSNSNFAQLSVYTSSLYSRGCRNNSYGAADNVLMVLAPVKKGDTFRITYTNVGSLELNFFYAQGSESEAS